MARGFDESCDGKVFPTSFAQRRIWFLYQLDPSNPQYHLPAALRIRGALDIEALEWALNEEKQLSCWSGWRRGEVGK